MDITNIMLEVNSCISGCRQILAEHYKALILVEMWFPPPLSCV